MVFSKLHLEGLLRFRKKNIKKGSDGTNCFSVSLFFRYKLVGLLKYLFCQTNKCSTLILQDPFFVPIIEELDNIELNTNSYFIYSQDWYQGYEDDNSISEIEVYREYTKNKELAEGYYLTDSAHYDFVAFGIISQLTNYTFLKGSIDYKDSLQTNNYFNIA